MSIDPRFIELINADIDGEIDAGGKADLEVFLANSEEGRALYEDLSGVAHSLNDLPDLDPPAHLHHLLMSRAPSGPKPKPQSSPGFFARLVENPVLGYVGMFAAGVGLTLAVVQSDQISSGALDDMTGLVGTVADPEFAAPEHGSLAIDENEVAGTVKLRSAGSILIVDFDLAAREPVEIVARYADETIWFNGFAQLESAGPVSRPNPAASG